MTPTVLLSGGTGKSGTTIVGSLLGRHPDVVASRPREVRFITDSCGLLQACYGPIGKTPVRTVRRSLVATYHSVLPSRHDASVVRAFEDRLNRRWWDRPTPTGQARGLHTGIDRVEVDRLLSAFHRDFRGDNEQAARDFLYGFIQSQQGYEGQQFWIDTTPKNIESASRITRLIPDARFIHMVRDGRETAVSITKQPWGPDEPFKALRWWAKRLERAWRGSRDLPESALLTVHLENLVVDAREETLAAILSFLDLEPRPRMRRFFDERMPADRVQPGKWQQAVDDPRAFDTEFERLVAGMLERGVPAALITSR